jgi:hypothetical protein
MDTLQSLLKDVKVVKGMIEVEENKVLKSERVFKVDSLTQAQDLVEKEYAGATYNMKEDDTPNLYNGAFILNETKVAEFDDKEKLLTFFDENEVIDEEVKDDSTDEVDVNKDDVKDTIDEATKEKTTDKEVVDEALRKSDGMTTKEEAPGASYYKSIIEHGNEPYQGKAWDSFTKCEYSIYDLCYIVKNCKEPYKEKAWRILIKNKKELDYWDLRNIVQDAEEPYKAKAWALILKKK